MSDIRASVVTRRTYNRPLNDEGTVFETWEATVDRVIGHQQWLWERAKADKLNQGELGELNEFRELMLARKALTSGRTLWLGGTDVAKKHEASQFNCSFGKIETVHDVVDAFWLLLQGCGVGFEPVVGTLNGFAKETEIETFRSSRTTKGREGNVAETRTIGDKRIYKLSIGDSAKAWAKALGKLMALKEPVDKIILDYTEIRPAGTRLKGYGWISSGDDTLHIALGRICDIMNKRAGQLLTRMDILDVLNHMGTTLSSRRSAEIAVMPVTDTEVDEFISAKKDFWLHDNAHRQQSNNSLMFWNKPTKWELSYIFDRMVEAGGSEPGFINAEAAKKRAPHFKGVNPCAEILLGNKSFCNLVEIDWGKYLNDFEALNKAVYLAARANYRQTCVNLDDGILQRSWHELNEFLRLCGVGATGIVKFLDHNKHKNISSMLQQLRASAQSGANDIADELGLPRPKLVSTVKPSGTLSKIMSTTEGVHKPLGKYLFNNVTFSKHDPIVPIMTAAGYKVIEKPFEPDSVLVTFPVAYDDVEFEEVDGKFVNLETAVEQLDRYKLMMDNYVDHNCSVTISYDPTEIPSIIEWILTNWDSYVGVSFSLGQQFGLLSGGCLESDIQRYAKEVMASGQPTTICYDGSDEDDISFQFGIGCGCTVYILLQPITEQNSYLQLEALAESLARRESSIYLQKVMGDSAEAQLLTEADQNNSQYLQITAQLGSSKAKLLMLETGAGRHEYLATRITPPIHLLVVGGGVDARPLVGMASILGWEVSVCDPRPANARREHFMSVDNILDCPVSKLPEHWLFDTFDAAILMSHNLQMDAQALSVLQGSRADYLALLGPQSRRASVI